ncbi:hypothetical protein OF83DRAFT_1174911 [Amylostereum chailletii]|nr:hypothetical protein OF83DRAFT_1174911 [Amylostereum chailletii]
MGEWEGMSIQEREERVKRGADREHTTEPREEVCQRAAKWWEEAICEFVSEVRKTQQEGQEDEKRHVLAVSHGAWIEVLVKELVEREWVTKPDPALKDMRIKNTAISHLTALQALYLCMHLSPPSAPTTSSCTILIWGGATTRPGCHAKIKEAAGALDAASEVGSTDWTVDSIGAQGGRVITFTLGYTLLGNVTTFVGMLSYPVMPEDNAAAGAWMENEL